MSISSEINRIDGNVSSAFGAVRTMGGTVPSGANSDDLASAIRSIPQEGGGGVIPMTEITWSALKALRDGGSLVPGMQYRITDYTTIVTGYYDLSALAEGVQGYLHYGDSAGHQFDVIVTADDESNLNENARAALHEGDTYFANSDLAAWELKYCLDNDATRFSFANASGKGVIFGMKDEFGNECGYDFKNWQFVRYALALSSAEGSADVSGLVYDNTNGQHKRYGSPYHVIKALMSYMSAGEYVNPFKTNYELACGQTILASIRSAEIDATYKTTFGAELYYTFDFYDITNDEHLDFSLGGVEDGVCKNNVIPLCNDPLGTYLEKLSIGNSSVRNSTLFGMIGVGCNVFQSTGVYASMVPFNVVANNRLGDLNIFNTFSGEVICADVSLGAYCADVSLGAYCADVSLGASCADVSLGAYCADVSLGASCADVSLGASCADVSLGASCADVSLGAYCADVSLGASCADVSLGASCADVSLGAYCADVSLGADCENIRLGQRCLNCAIGRRSQNNTIEGYFKNLEMAAGCENVDLQWSNHDLLNDRSPFTLKIGRIKNVTIPISERPSSGYAEIQTYDAGSGNATLIVYTGPNTKTVKNTTDGGQTWTSA